MEINKYTDIRPVFATEAIPEGRMVLITTHAESYNFGSWVDLVGIKLPDTATEAALAFYVASFALTNNQTPIYEPYPAMDFALRQGFDKPSNVPFNAAVHLTPPENKLFGTIPIGPARAFGQGEFTVYSGGYVPNDNLAPGAHLEALNAADDTAAEAGKLSYIADTTGAVATVVNYDSDKQTLTFRTFNP